MANDLQSLRFADLLDGEDIGPVEKAPSPLDLFLYSAAVWIPHRIHYDHAYTRDVEGFDGLLVHGPLQGAYAAQMINDWAGENGRLRFLRYRNMAVVNVGEKLVCGGRIEEISRDDKTVTCSFWVRKDDGTETTRGDAMVAFT